jgi:hypothetical protein
MAGVRMQTRHLNFDLTNIDLKTILPLSTIVRIGVRLANWGA